MSAADKLGIFVNEDSSTGVCTHLVRGVCPSIFDGLVELGEDLPGLGMAIPLFGQGWEHVSTIRHQLEPQSCNKPCLIHAAVDVILLLRVLWGLQGILAVEEPYYCL